MFHTSSQREPVCLVWLLTTCWSDYDSNYTGFTDASLRGVSHRHVVGYPAAETLSAEHSVGDCSISFSVGLHIYCKWHCKSCDHAD